MHKHIYMLHTTMTNVRKKGKSWESLEKIVRNQYDDLEKKIATYNAIANLNARQLLSYPVLDRQITGETINGTQIL